MPAAAQDVRPYLEDLAERIDDTVERDLQGQWLKFWAGDWPEAIFTPARGRQAPAKLDWPPVRVNHALEDYDLMLLHQLAGCSGLLASGGGSPMSVRCNYGVGILPTLFGAELFIMDEELDCLPNVRPVPGGADAAKRLLDAGVPDLRAGLGERVFTMADRYREAFADHPALARHVHVYHPDMQGPMDVCELIWGSGIFLDLYEQPSLVHDLLGLICQTYEDYMHEWWRHSPEGELADGLHVHWSLYQRGRIMLRDDSAMNLSPEMFDEFIRPYNQRLLDSLGGGCDHFCGRGDHWIASGCSIAGLHGINLSQPHLNDLETIYRHTVDRGIPLLGLQRETAEKSLAEGRDLKHRVHCG